MTENNNVKKLHEQIKSAKNKEELFDALMRSVMAVLTIADKDLEDTRRLLFAHGFLADIYSRIIDRQDELSLEESV